MFNYSSQAFRMRPLDLPDGYTLIDTVPEDMRDYIHPHWSRFAPVHPLWHVSLGFIYVVLGVVSVTGELYISLYLIC